MRGTSDEEKERSKAAMKTQKAAPATTVVRQCCAEHEGGGMYTWTERRGANGKCPGVHVGGSR